MLNLSLPRNLSIFVVSTLNFCIFVIDVSYVIRCFSNAWIFCPILVMVMVLLSPFDALFR